MVHAVQPERIEHSEQESGNQHVLADGSRDLLSCLNEDRGHYWTSDEALSEQVDKQALQERLCRSLCRHHGGQWQATFVAWPGEPAV